MPGLSVDDLILSPAAYAEVRPARRAAAIEQRRVRRVPVGDIVLVEFESQATLLYQAQEMLHVERVTDADVAAAEMAVYERLLPTVTSVAATLLIAIDDPAQVRAVLSRLDGLHESVRLEVGSQGVRARDVPPPDEGPTEHTVSVHFLRFDLTDELVGRLRAGEPTTLTIDHPRYHSSAALSAELVALLADDMAAAAG